MDERTITARILEYLLESCFNSKAEMARALGMEQRTLEKVFARLDIAKGATIALGKSLNYCLRHGVLLDPIFHGLFDESGNLEQLQGDALAAYNRLNICKPCALSVEGERFFESMHIFLCCVSALICPKCKSWCNPWNGSCDSVKLDCCIGHMAREIIKDVAEFYTAEGDDG